MENDACWELEPYHPEIPGRIVTIPQNIAKVSQDALCQMVAHGTLEYLPRVHSTLQRQALLAITCITDASKQCICPSDIQTGNCMPMVLVFVL